MSTSLFDKIIFGPVQSRRLGLSLGINLLLPSAKHCNFDCIYCECGWNAEHPNGSFNSADSVISRLEQRLTQMGVDGQLPDYITFAGNGEPTMHPDFAAIIERTIASVGRLAPKAKIAVLSNATMIDREPVRRALLRVDRNILKFDSAIDATVRLINQPQNQRSVEQTIELLQKFDGRLVIQTMFIRGIHNGTLYDNTTDSEVAAWLDALSRIAPNEVMLYSIARDTPDKAVERVELQDLERIALQVESLGIKAIVT